MRRGQCPPEPTLKSASILGWSILFVAVTGLVLATRTVLSKSGQRQKTSDLTVIKPRTDKTEQPKVWTLLAVRPDGNRPLGKVSERLHTSVSPLLVGRGSHCDVVLESSEVSRNQFKLFFSNGVLYCADLQSANGTLLNGRALNTTPSKIDSAADISAGDYRLLLVPQNHSV